MIKRRTERRGIPRDTPDRRANIFDRLEKYFAENPQQELTFKALVRQFGCHPKTAQEAISQLAALGTIERVRVIRLARTQTEPEKESES